MTDYSVRFDNELGKPIFQPHLTGDSLQGQALDDWEDFCLAVVTNDEALYNTWFENRYRRMDYPRHKSVVRATEHNGTICICCPSKIWATELFGHMPKWRGLTPRKLYVLAPGERGPDYINPALSPSQLAQLKIDIATCEREGRTALLSIGRGLLARHEKATT